MASSRCGWKFSVFHHCLAPLSFLEPSLLPVSGEWIPAVAHANWTCAAIQVGSAADWVPSGADEDAQPCSSCRNSLAKRCPCASDPRMLTGVRWQPGACSFMEPNGPELCWDDEELEGSLSAKKLKFPVTSSPLLMAAYFYSKECFFSSSMVHSKAHLHQH